MPAVFRHSSMDLLEYHSRIGKGNAHCCMTCKGKKLVKKCFRRYLKAFSRFLRAIEPEKPKEYPDCPGQDQYGVTRGCHARDKRAPPLKQDRSQTAFSSVCGAFAIGLPLLSVCFAAYWLLSTARVAAHASGAQSAAQAHAWFGAGQHPGGGRAAVRR